MHSRDDEEMTNNSTQANTSESGCVFNRDIVLEYAFYSSIVCSAASFVGNICIICIVYKTKTLRTTTNFFIVNMAVSDVFVPALDMLNNGIFYAPIEYSPVLTQNLGVALCKIISFFLNTSYGVSMSSLVVITVHRFYAVALPMRARLETVKTRVILLVCTWLGPISVCSPLLYYTSYSLVGRTCCHNMIEQHFSILSITFLVLFGSLPFLFLLVLYPVIVVKLVRQKVPGNSSSQSQVIRKRLKQNIRLTKMFITIIVTLLLTYGTSQVVYVICYFLRIVNRCTSVKLYLTVYPLRNIFHAVNPAIYFMFCSTYRQGFKQICSCCCRQSTVRPNSLGGEQMEPGNVQQD